MTSQLQRQFSNNITTLCRLLLVDVVFATLLQLRDMVERRRDLKTNILQRLHDVVCLRGYISFYIPIMVICSLDALKESSKNKETKIKKEVEMLQQNSYGKERISN